MVEADPSLEEYEAFRAESTARRARNAKVVEDVKDTRSLVRHPLALLARGCNFLQADAVSELFFSSKLEKNHEWCGGVSRRPNTKSARKPMEHFEKACLVAEMKVEGECGSKSRYAVRHVHCALARTRTVARHLLTCNEKPFRVSPQ